MEPPPELFAWVGEDELGSGEVGLKQGLTPAGMIALVATKQEKMTQDYLVTQLRAQVARWGKPITLVRYQAVGAVLVLPHPKP